MHERPERHLVSVRTLNVGDAKFRKLIGTKIVQISTLSVSLYYSYQRLPLQYVVYPTHALSRTQSDTILPLSRSELSEVIDEHDVALRVIGLREQDIATVG